MAGDIVQTNHYTKPKVTIGGRITGKIEIKGKGTSKVVPLSGRGSLSLGVFSDNYTGIGADISANAGISLNETSEAPFTASLGLGVTSSTGSGVDVSPLVNLGIKEMVTSKIIVNAGLSASLGYNSRSGLKALTLGSIFKGKYTADEVNPQKNVSIGFHGSGSLISYNTQPILPNIQIPYKSRSGTFSIDLGPAIIIFLCRYRWKRLQECTRSCFGAIEQSVLWFSLCGAGEKPKERGNGFYKG